MAAKNRTIDMRGLALQVASIELFPTAAANNNVAGGATKTLTSVEAGKTIQLDTAAGSVITLPASVGLGAVYTFVTSVLATSNSHIIKVANASDIMVGYLTTIDSTAGTTALFGTVAASDTITLNRTTTGGGLRTGERIVLRDVALNRWEVDGNVFTSGTAATPFSATV